MGLHPTGTKPRHRPLIRLRLTWGSWALGSRGQCGSCTHLDKVQGFKHSSWLFSTFFLHFLCPTMAAIRCAPWTDADHHVSPQSTVTPVSNIPQLREKEGQNLHQQTRSSANKAPQAQSSFQIIPINQHSSDLTRL